MFKRILVAVDRSSAAASPVLAEAEAIALAHQAKLHLVHVLSPVQSGYPDPAYMTIDRALSTVNLPDYKLYLASWEEIQQQTQAQLQSWTEEARRQGISTTATQMVGDPGKAICTLAQDWSADLIVIGRRGMHGLGELLLGSVSSYVMHRSPCAVLVVQGHGEAEVASQ
jgi:nucleotide-binding universal stress UspA family protein